ncbi:MAG: tRNA preQ1(34) S-adenosylmethionine ribosyltransferase-isomerase QueA [Gammaproteobacteria bacterium]|nr:tRNA preQ1(34) S-adenosylmethionine ribosyltransferase-isomerase QueA [Gammaproteobacteria bacterium]
MQVSDFHYELPSHLIAKHPTPIRSASRLMHLNVANGEIAHYQFSDLPTLLDANDLLVFNNTRVIPARLFGKKESGGQVEILLERIVDTNSAKAQIRSSKSPLPGSEISLDNSSIKVRVKGRDGPFYNLVFPDPGVSEIAEELGHMPLPPYIDREDEIEDRERYQTIYATRDGAVAAPTSGLHFDDALFAELERRGIGKVEVTLHVGAGTFQPVRVEKIEDHRMHAEWLQVPATVCDEVKGCRKANGRVVAVGTTSVRSLESASETGLLAPFEGDTDIFIYPGYEFRSVDAMITNFHLPGSTLIMLVSAFAGMDNVKHAYNVAIQESYRFFSYGDAMLITR